MPTKNDVAWEKYINDTNILLDGTSHFINATNLKETAKREPRLLAKMDKPRDRPRIFRDAGYSLLAVKNGEYLIFRGNTFAEIPTCSPKKLHKPSLAFELLTAGRGTGEAEYLDNAFNTGIISDFTENDILYQTIRGRERTGCFDFSFGNNNTVVSVDGVQIEVDAGFEGEDEIILIEGKIGKRDYFNIRQIYYPYRHFRNLVPSKKIRNLFFSYDLSEATYTLYEFNFRDDTIFDSLHLVNCFTYNLVESINYQIDELLDVQFESENNIIPQADDTNKILELLALVNTGQDSKEEIADYFVFSLRQSSYYGEAAESLGLLKRSRGFVDLTPLGKDFITTSPPNQQLFLAKAIINSWFFRNLISIAKGKGYFNNSDIAEVIMSTRKDDGTQRYTSSTIPRRIRTLTSWAKWLTDEFSCFEIVDGEYRLI